MKTEVIKINREKPLKKYFIKAAEIVKKGGVIVFPTDTVYGLAAGAFNLKAQKKIYGLKGRSFRKPLILMANEIKALENFVEINEDAKRIIKNFWPGPLTLILPTTPIGKIMMGGRKDAGVRIPKDKIVSALIKALGVPIATTSANISGKPSAKKASEAVKYFKNKLELIIDGGNCDLGQESTVIDMVKFPYIVVRQGAMPAKKILKCF